MSGRFGETRGVVRCVTGFKHVLMGFRPGVARRLELDYETVRAINPQIVYCSLTGYGQDGPYKDLPGHDLNYISIAGAASAMAIRDGRPAVPLNLLDYAGGLQAAFGIVPTPRNGSMTLGFPRTCPQERPKRLLAAPRLGSERRWAIKTRRRRTSNLRPESIGSRNRRRPRLNGSTAAF